MLVAVAHYFELHKKEHGFFPTVDKASRNLNCDPKGVQLAIDLVCWQTRDWLLKVRTDHDYMYDFPKIIHALMDRPTHDHCTYYVPSMFHLIIESNSISEPTITNLGKNNKQVYVGKRVIHPHCETHYFSSNFKEFFSGQSTVTLDRLIAKANNLKCGLCSISGFASTHVDLYDGVRPQRQEGLFYRGSIYEKILIKEHSINSAIRLLSADKLRQYMQTIQSNWGEWNTPIFTNSSHQLQY